jgi:hypothetical protein
MEDTAIQLITAYLGQIDSAMKVSAILSEHNGDDSISPDNLIIGLIYRLMVPMTKEEIESSTIVAKKIMNPEESSEEEDEEEEEDFMIDSTNGTSLSRRIKANNCNCDICIKARVCLINYPTYESSDVLADKFHNSIKHACYEHKLII